jgi:DNA-binding NarL/FixJ family response regulator
MTRILIDDHDFARSGLQAILSGQPGWQMGAEAENGRRAVELMAKARPHVAMRKTNAHSTADPVRYAIRNNLVEP